MRAQGKMWVIGACLATLLLPALCDRASARPPGRAPAVQPGPPAHAPAYGARRKQVAGFELAFDPGTGVYVVVGAPGVYYADGCFYRVHNGIWEIRLHGTIWRPIAIGKLPPGLQAKAKSTSKANGNGVTTPRGNPGGNGNKVTASPRAGGDKPNGSKNNGVDKPKGGKDNNANKPDGKGGKPETGKDNGTNKSNGGKDNGASKSNAGKETNANKPKGDGSKPAGNADDSANKSNAGGNTAQAGGKPGDGSAKSDAKPAGNGKADSAPKGKR